jgi:phosphatidylglycerophosphate synthase
MNMEKNTVSKYTISFGLALALSSVINALLVVAKEKSPTIRAEMQRLTGSHWITHVAIVLILFVAFGFLSANIKKGQGITMPVNGLIKTIIAGVFVAGLIIVGFYLVAD